MGHWLSEELRFQHMNGGGAGTTHQRTAVGLTVQGVGSSSSTDQLALVSVSEASDSERTSCFFSRRLKERQDQTQTCEFLDAYEAFMRLRQNDMHESGT